MGKLSTFTSLKNPVVSDPDEIPALGQDCYGLYFLPSKENDDWVCELRVFLGHISRNHARFHSSFVNFSFLGSHQDPNVT